MTIYPIRIHHKVLGYLLFWFIAWHVLILGVVYMQKPEPEVFLCPGEYIIHGVGSDLKTYTKTMDTCGSEYQRRMESR